MKTKSRNLLTIILAALCAAAVALGIGLILPKAEKISANAVTCSAVVNGGGVVSGSATELVWSPGYSLAETTTDTANNTSVSRLNITMTVPAYTEYTVSYSITLRVILSAAATGSGTATAQVTAKRYSDSTYSTVKQTLTIANGTGSVGNSSVGLDDKTTIVSNLIFTNNDSVSKDFVTYFDLTLQDVVKYKAARFLAVFYLDNDSSTVTATKLPVPTTNDTLTMDYDGNPHAVNFEYSKVQPARNDLDGLPHNYTTGYKNVDVTVDAEDGDGNTITAPTLNLDANEGKGSISATNAGTYTVKFNLSPSAISNGIEWIGGGTGQKTIVLTINKINPTVNPIFGEPDEVDGNPGKWYISNDLYNDITIETTTGDTPATSDTPGTISWDAGQSLTAGTRNYGWTFTPTDTRNYNTKTGTKSITVESITISSIKATFNQGTAKFYTSNRLDDLKVKLAVDKVYNDNTTARLANSDYELTGDISSAGTATITVTYTSLNTEDPALEEFTDTFTVEITAVAIKSISASFNPTGDIYLSNSLDDLKQYLTVNATYNDGKTKNNISNYTLSTDSGALALGTVTVTVTSDEDNTVIDTFDVEVIPDIVPVVLPLPQVKDYTYSGEELDVAGALTTLTEEDVIKYLDVTGTATARRAGEYTVKYKIKDDFLAAGNISWDTSNLSDLPNVQLSADGNSVEFKWNILKAKVTAKWDEEECLWTPVIVGTLAETTEPDFLINTYTNSDGKEFKNRENLAGGRTYQVTATINPQYANDFELDENSQTQINSGSEKYTYTPPYVPSIWEKILAFLKANWLWFVIAAAALILLIIIIVVAKKCHKTKEQREEIRARKEEEKLRREEERRLQQERLQAERDLARAKQEAELEKIRAQAQAGMAGAGMATMAMAQPVQQSVPQVADNGSNELLKEITRQMAEMRAENKATQEKLAAMQSQPQYAPQYYQPQYGDSATLARLEAQLNAMQVEQRARYEAEQRIELAAMRAESHVDRDSRHSVDLAAMREQLNGRNYNTSGQLNSIDALGALVAAALKNIAGETAVTQTVPELPQNSEQNTPVEAKYPSDAVITTTTTVDTTKGSTVRRSREEDTFDVDGFYDTFE